MLPEQDIAIATTSGLPDMQRILTLIWDILPPAVTCDTLPENPADQNELTGLLSTLSIPLASGDLTRRHAPAVWKFRPNEAGITDVAVSFGEKDCLLEFHSRHGTEKLRAGFGFNCDNLLRLNDSLPRRTAASAAWISENVLEIRLCCYEASFRGEFRLDFASMEKPLAGSCRFCTFRSPFLPELTAE